MATSARHSKGYITANGIRIRHPERLADLTRQPAVPQPTVPQPDRPIEWTFEGRPVYAFVATVPHQHDARNGVEHILEAVMPDLRDAWEACPRLTRDAVIDLAPSRYAGVRFRHEIQPGTSWHGDLQWRTVHPGHRGTPVTTRVFLEETESFTRMHVRVTADLRDTELGEFFSRGDAKPAFVAQLAAAVTPTWLGRARPVETLRASDVPDFVASVLNDPCRQVPSAVLAPFEKGDGYGVEPDQLGQDLFGRAHLWVLADQEASFALTDAVGDARHSCYRGALRAYMPGWSHHDDPHTHPLLLGDRISDPVMRAQWVGRLGMWMAERIELPPCLGTPDTEVAAPRMPSEVAPHLSPDVAPEDPPAPPASVSMAVSLATPAPLALPTATATARAAAPAIAPATAPATVPQPSAFGVEMRAILHALRDDQQDLLDAVGTIAATVGSTASDVEGLRILSSVRSARSKAIERRLERLERLMERFFRDGISVDTADTSPESDENRTPLMEEEGDGQPTLEEVVMRAADVHDDDLLILPSAIKSAAESPFVGVAEVAATLEAMAVIAARRREGSLNTQLRTAFADLGQDYRSGVAETTPARLREQYRFSHPTLGEFEGVEHLVLGRTYDPRWCLRIYFSTRVQGEPRFVIGHIGRHFEVLTSS
jgi:hypothetical protein